MHISEQCPPVQLPPHKPLNRLSKDMQRKPLKNGVRKKIEKKGVRFFPLVNHEFYWGTKDRVGGRQQTSSAMRSISSIAIKWCAFIERLLNASLCELKKKKKKQGSEILTATWGQNWGWGEKSQARCLTKLQQVTLHKRTQIGSNYKAIISFLSGGALACKQRNSLSLVLFTHLKQ